MRWLRLLLYSLPAAGITGLVVAHAATVEETASTTTNYTGTAAVTYIGKWHTTEITRNWSGGTAAASTWGPSTSAPECRSDTNVPASRVTLSFSGTGVRWIGARGPQMGKARVFVDGVLQLAVVDAYAPARQSVV